MKRSVIGYLLPVMVTFYGGVAFLMNGDPAKNLDLTTLKPIGAIDRSAIGNRHYKAMAQLDDVSFMASLNPSVTAATGCASVGDSGVSVSSDSTGNAIVGYNNTDVAQQFTCSSNYTVCSLNAQVKKSGSPTTETITVSICANNAGAPGTQVGTASGAVSISTFSTSPVTNSWTGLSAALTSGTVYWVKMHISSADHTGWANWEKWNTASGNTTFSISIDGGTTWTPTTSALQLQFQIFHP